MPIISFKTKKEKGTKFGGLKVQKYSPTGDEPLRAVKLVNGRGTMQLASAETYTLHYGYYGEPGGTFTMEVIAPDGSVLLAQTDTIPANKLADSGGFPFVTP